MSSRWQNSLLIGKRLLQTGNALRKTGTTWLKDRDTPPEELARQTCENLGTTYIKLGQLIASSPSLFPHNYVKSFQNCFDNAPAVPFEEIERILTEQLGPNLQRYYQYIDPTPLATASIAQVHAATLVSGESVVIKVQKPGVENILQTDFQLMEWSAKLFERVNKNIPRDSIRDIVIEMRDGMLEECDFLKEANNIQVFEQFLKERQINYIIVPKVYPMASNTRVLTMERLHGKSVSELIKNNGITPPLQILLSQAINVWIDSVQHCSIYHADLHAGNLIAIDENTLGFIDFGIVGHMEQQLWEDVSELMHAGKSADFDRVAQLLCKIGATNQQIDQQQLANDIKTIFTTDIAQENFFLELSHIAQQHGIRFPRAFTLLLKQLLYFDNFINPSKQ